MTEPGGRYESVPEDLRIARRWLLWRIDQRNGKPTKVPYSVAGSKASTRESVTWTTFNEAAEALARSERTYSGLGFVLGGGFLGIDIDDCLTTGGEPNALGQHIVEAVGSYAEISPSGRGLHILAKGSLPRGPRRTKVGESRLEMYDANRYFTVTGQLFDERFGYLASAQEAIDDVYARYFVIQVKPKPEQSDSTPTEMHTLDSASVLRGLEKLPNSESAKALFNGDDSAYGEDKSAADLAFCSFIKQALGANAELIDQAYRVSARYRPKWDVKHSADGQTYGAMTIKKAMQPSPADIGDSITGKTSDPHLHLVPASEVRVKAVEWLMPNRIPKGEVVLFEGDGGIGKTTAALDIIARASSGRALPDGSMLDFRPNVLIVAEEDDLSTLTARLRVADADLSRISFVDYVNLQGGSSVFMLPDHAALLRKAIQTSGSTLVYIDSLFNHINPKLKANNFQDVRSATAPLTMIAHDLVTTTIATRHWTKQTGSASVRGLGSADLRNLSRATLTFGKHPRRSDIPPVYVVAVSKSNYGKTTDSLLYQVETVNIEDDFGKSFDVGRIHWLGSDAITADDVAGERKPKSGGRPFERACRVLQDALADEADGLTAEQLDDERAKSGIASGTWNVARSHLHKRGKIRRDGGGQAGHIRWYSVCEATDADSHIA